MKDFMKIGLGFIGGVLLTSYVYIDGLKNGKVVYEDDDIIIKSDRPIGWYDDKIEGQFAYVTKKKREES